MSVLFNYWFLSNKITTVVNITHVDLLVLGSFHLNNLWISRTMRTSFSGWTVELINVIAGRSIYLGPVIEYLHSSWGWGRNNNIKTKQKTQNQKNWLSVSAQTICRGYSIFIILHYILANNMFASKVHKFYHWYQ